MSVLIENCRKLISAYEVGLLGQTVMPEDTHPDFTNLEEKLSFYSLPMALNYQRDSYKLWEAATKTFEGVETKKVFDIKWVNDSSEDDIREFLLKYKLALQSNKHINTWKRISDTVYSRWESWEAFIKNTEYDFLKLKEIVQTNYKKGFPYLSGPKIFNYWSHILQKYCDIDFENSEFIEIAPDTHITKCSVKLGVISESEAKKLTKDQISDRWRELLKGSGIDPIDMHEPLWFWSRNGFIYEL